MLDSFLQRHLAPRLAPVQARLSHSVTATGLAVAGFAFGAASLPAIGFRKYLLALGFLVLWIVVDGLRGLLALPATRVEATLGRVLELLVCAAVPFAFALAQPDRALAAMFLLLGLVARAGTAAVSEKHAWLGTAELFAAFAIACIFPSWFSIIAYAIGILCFVDAGTRLAAEMSS